MNYKVLNSNKDLYEWEDLFNRLPSHYNDIYFKPSYMNLYKKKDSEALIFAYYENEYLWIYPFFLTKINKKFYNTNQKIYSDIESVYGYSGPLSNNSDTLFLEKAVETFNLWCEKNNIVAEFIRFHPLLNNNCYHNKDIQIIHDRNTVSIDINNFNNYQKKFDSKTRNMIKKFYKTKNYIKRSNLREDYNLFVDLYLTNMKLLKADKYYLFNNQYFDDLFNFLLQNGVLIAAFDEFKQLIGGALIFYSNNYAHYHLASTLKTSKYAGVSNAIIEEAIEISSEKSKSKLHLGGGVTSDKDDKLLKFKISMGNDINKFYIGKKIHNDKIYNEIKNTYISQNINYNKNKILFYKDI